VNCRLCRRETDSEFCAYHSRARSEVAGAYKSWSEAYGELTWREYLNRVIKNPETGQWAVEVAKLMLDKEE
jgi:hypothetical protein